MSSLPFDALFAVLLAAAVVIVAGAGILALPWADDEAEASARAWAALIEVLFGGGHRPAGELEVAPYSLAPLALSPERGRGRGGVRLARRARALATMPLGPDLGAAESAVAP